MHVSVIIPTYNSGGYIKAAIESVLNQTYQNLELIIIDDGSTDNTKEIVESYNDKRIKYFYQENSGVANARNTGLKNSNGEYIAFLDADDYWKPEKLAVQIEAITADNGICMVYSGFDMIYEDRDSSKTFRYTGIKEKDFIKNLLTNPFKTIPYPSAVLISKFYLDKVGDFNSDFPTGEDWDLWLRLAAFGRCCYIDRVLVKKLTHNTSITNSLSLEKTGEYHFRLLDKFFLNNPEYKPLQSKAHSMIYYDIACRYYGRNNHLPTNEVYINLFKSFLTYPQLYLAKTKLQAVINMVVKSNVKKLINRAFAFYL